MENIKNVLVKHSGAFNYLIYLALFTTGWFYPFHAIGATIIYSIIGYVVITERKLKKLKQERLALEEKLATAETTIQKLEPSLQEEIKRAETAEEKCDRLDRDLRSAITSLEQNRDAVQQAIRQRDKLADDLRVSTEAVKNLDIIKVQIYEQLLAWSFRLRAPHESVNPPKGVVQTVTKEMETWVRHRHPADRVDALLYRHEQETQRKT